eukprot:6181115-Pleurochrysis_carterae.AAC.1
MHRKRSPSLQGCEEGRVAGDALNQQLREESDNLRNVSAQHLPKYEKQQVKQTLHARLRNMTDPSMPPVWLCNALLSRDENARSFLGYARLCEMHLYLMTNVRIDPKAVGGGLASWHTYVACLSIACLLWPAG